MARRRGSGWDMRARKANTYRPWAETSGAVPTSQGGWSIVGPTSEPYAPNHPAPGALIAEEIPTIVEAFATAAQRADSAGFDLIELHAAHGHLLHGF